MEDLSKKVGEFRSAVEARQDERERLREFVAGAQAASAQLTAFAEALGPQSRPNTAPTFPDHFSILPETAKRAAESVNAEGVAIGKMIDEIAQRYARIAQLKQQLERARTLRTVLIVGGILVVVVIILMTSC